GGHPVLPVQAGRPAQAGSGPARPPGPGEPGMRGERALLRLGESLVRRGWRRLPVPTRDDRYREWAAELPAILHDPEVRLAPYRALRMLAYAADTLRGTALTPRPAHRPARSWAVVSSIAGLMVMAWSSWSIVRAPE